MKPWILIDKAQTPGHGAELCLYQRDQEFAIQADNLELMNSRIFGSEQALATLACQKINDAPTARVLIGGLGMGYTLKSALDELGTKAEVVVAELVPAVVRWNQGVLAHLAGNPLGDERVIVQEGDVAQMIKRGRGSFSAILLDVDNGPEALTRPYNGWLYSPKGLQAAYQSLIPGGVLGIWSAAPDSKLTARLRKNRFEVEVLSHTEKGRPTEDGSGTHILWMAKRPK